MEIPESPGTAPPFKTTPGQADPVSADLSATKPHVWLMRGERPIDSARANVGVADAARGIVHNFKELIANQRSL